MLHNLGGGQEQVAFPVPELFLFQSGPAYVKTFLSVLRNVFKEETAEYVLALIHSLLAGMRPALLLGGGRGGEGVARFFCTVLACS